MSKTIIITTDEMNKILDEYLDRSTVLDVYCQHCSAQHEGLCPLEDTDFCPEQTDNEYLNKFINLVFANYMIPFS